MSERTNATSDAAKAAYPDPETISVAGNTFPEWLQRQLQEAYDRGVRGEIMRRNKLFKSRMEDDQADIIGWFGSHSSAAIRTVIDAGEAIIRERADDPE